MPSAIEAVWDEHTRQEFALRDPSAALKTMTGSPSVNHVPVMSGGNGLSAVSRFYEQHFIGQSPADFTLTPVSRTVGEISLVDEFICRFTHDIAMDWMLPGVAPTGRHVELPVVAIVVFEGGYIAHERVYWDQASVLVQVGLLDPSKLPIVGAEAAARVAGRSVSSNRLIDDAVSRRSTAS